MTYLPLYLAARRLRSSRHRRDAELWCERMKGICAKIRSLPRLTWPPAILTREVGP